ncbi:MAG: hypothetical protein ACM3N0_02670 [Chloroflexota bacterium]
MVLAQIGPLTNVLEAFATAVAAGVVLGSVGVGASVLHLGGPAAASETAQLPMAISEA